MLGIVIGIVIGIVMRWPTAASINSITDLMMRLMSAPSSLAPSTAPSTARRLTRRLISRMTRISRITSRILSRITSCVPPVNIPLTTPAPTLGLARGPPRMLYDHQVVERPRDQNQSRAEERRREEGALRRRACSLEPTKHLTTLHLDKAPSVKVCIEVGPVVGMADGTVIEKVVGIAIGIVVGIQLGIELEIELGIAAVGALVSVRRRCDGLCWRMHGRAVGFRRPITYRQAVAHNALALGVVEQRDAEHPAKTVQDGTQVWQFPNSTFVTSALFLGVSSIFPCRATNVRGRHERRLHCDGLGRARF